VAGGDLQGDDDGDDDDDDEYNDDIDDDSDDDFGDSDEYNDDDIDDDDDNYNDDYDTIYSFSSLTISSAIYLSRSLSSRPSMALTTSSMASTGTLSTALFKDDRSLKCRAILIAR